VLKCSCGCQEAGTEGEGETVRAGKERDLRQGNGWEEEEEVSGKVGWRTGEGSSGRKRTQRGKGARDGEKGKGRGREHDVP
jgi:hypothetical protein